MRQVFVRAFGGVEQLEVREVPRTEPGPFEVRVRVLASAVSGADINMRRGTYPMRLVPPFTPGYSIVGVVDANGNQVHRFKPGQSVAALTITGGQAEFVNVPEPFLHPAPALDPVQVVPFVLDGMTAFQMLHRKVKLARGNSIFVHGASGAVGCLLTRLAVMDGVSVFGTASPAKHAAVRALGASVFDYGDAGFVDEILQRGGVDAVFDPLGFESFDRSYRMLKKGGTLVGYGFNQSTFAGTKRPIWFSFARLLSRNLVPDGRHTTFYSINRKSSSFAPDQAALFGLLEASQIKPDIRAVFPMDQIKEAHKFWAKGEGIGSLIIRV